MSLEVLLIMTEFSAHVNPPGEKITEKPKKSAGGRAPSGNPMRGFLRRFRRAIRDSDGRRGCFFGVPELCYTHIPEKSGAERLVNGGEGYG